jgi:uncharacterized membrane protein YoaK (UPF0700 family)
LKTSERDALLLALAAASGAADGWSFLALGHAFVANMTGNTVLLGLAVFTRHDLLHPAIAMVGYLFGTALAAFLTRNVPSGVIWARAVSWSLLAEAALISLVAADWAARNSAGLKAPPITVLLACLAVAIGMQSAAMLRLRIPGVVTTYITGTWTTLISGAVRLPRVREVQPQTRLAAFEERLLLQLGVLGMYVAAAILIGWLSRSAPGAMGAVPAAAVVSVALYGFLREEDSTGANE